ncbi:MAG: hypothetical protein EPO22_03060 [Dehalococcoidia bacterium]|nr:MAG: hypothetical protein EPO22_03060 [Dehalococcoidia bacterium]
MLLDEEEQQKQRELMERELDEQRWRREERAQETTADWQYEQEAGAKITGMVTAAIAAMAGIAMVMLIRRMLRRRRHRRIADLLPIS